MDAVWLTDAAGDNDGRTIEAWQGRAHWYRSVIAAVRRIMPDVVWLQHGTFLYGGGILAPWKPGRVVRALRQAGLTCVVEMHDVRSLAQVDSRFIRRRGYAGPESLWRIGLRLLVRNLAARSDLIIVHDERSRAALIREYGIETAKVRRVPHLPFERIPGERAEARRRLGLPAEACVLLFFGYAGDTKGLDELAEAMRLLSAEKDAPPILLVMASGMNPHLSEKRAYRAQYDRWRCEFSALPNARWVGFLPENSIDAYFVAADALIAPYTEAFGSSGPIARALSFPMPILVSAEAAPDGFPKELTFKALPHEIAGAIQRFAADESLRRRLFLSAVDAAQAVADTSYQSIIAELETRTAKRLLTENRR